MEPVVLPVTEEFKRKRKSMAIVAAIVILIAVGAFVTTLSYSVSTVNILTVELNISYTNGSGNWLGPPTQFLTGNYETLYAGGNYQYVITFTNHGSSTHSINGLNLNTTGFSLVSSSENIPLTLGPGESQNVALLIHLPDYNFVGDLDVKVTSY